MWDMIWYLGFPMFAVGVFGAPQPKNKYYDSDANDLYNSDNFDVVYDQRQNGTENYKVSIKMVLCCFVVLEKEILVSSGWSVTCMVTQFFIGCGSPFGTSFVRGVPGNYCWGIVWTRTGRTTKTYSTRKHKQNYWKSAGRLTKRFFQCENLHNQEADNGNLKCTNFRTKWMRTIQQKILRLHLRLRF